MLKVWRLQLQAVGPWSHLTTKSAVRRRFAEHAVDFGVRIIGLTSGLSRSDNSAPNLPRQPPARACDTGKDPGLVYDLKPQQSW